MEPVKITVEFLTLFFHDADFEKREYDSQRYHAALMDAVKRLEKLEPNSST
jgi:hypothetical protein